MLLEGDCRALAGHLNDAFWVSDPPYNQAYHYATYQDNLDVRVYQTLLSDVFRGRMAVVMHYPEELINLVAPALGPVREVMAWVYPSNQRKQHRLVGWWNCSPDWTQTPQPYRNPTDRRVMKLIAAGRTCRGYDWCEVNHVKNVSKVGHPCPIPLAVAERMVLATTQPGDTIVDPFCGAGTVLLAAALHGRNAVGCDIDPQYLAVAKKRLDAAAIPCKIEKLERKHP